jgi:hypothetical protein
MTSRIDAIIERLSQEADHRYPDWKTETLEVLHEHQYLLDLIKEQAPQVYQNYLQWYPDIPLASTWRNLVK